MAGGWRLAHAFWFPTVLKSVCGACYDRNQFLVKTQDDPLVLQFHMPSHCPTSGFSSISRFRPMSCNDRFDCNSKRWKSLKKHRIYGDLRISLLGWLNGWMHWQKVAMLVGGTGFVETVQGWDSSQKWCGHSKVSCPTLRSMSSVFNWPPESEREHPTQITLDAGVLLKTWWKVKERRTFGCAC